MHDHIELRANLQYYSILDLLDESLVVRKSSGRNSVVEEDINVEEMSTKQNLNRIAEDTKFLTVSENAAVVSQFLTSETSEASSLATKVADLVTSKSESRSFATPNSGSSNWCKFVFYLFKMDSYN